VAAKEESGLLEVRFEGPAPGQREQRAIQLSPLRLLARFPLEWPTGSVLSLALEFGPASITSGLEPVARKNLSAGVC
jgi:hypothetical protein